MRKLMLITAFLAIAASAQTVTYTVPAGESCNASLNGCMLQNLVADDPANPFAPYGWFVGGVYFTQFDFQFYAGQNAAAAGASYCAGIGYYTQTPRPDLGPNFVEWTLSCTSNEWTNGTGSGELTLTGPQTIQADIIAIWVTAPVRFCNRSGCVVRMITTWTVESGTVTVIGGTNT